MIPDGGNGSAEGMTAASPDPDALAGGSRRVLITGGGGDLARALADEFSAAGWDVDAPPRAELDVSDDGAVAAWVERGRPFHMLVHNAGFRIDSALARMGEDDWDRVIAVHLTGSHRLARSAVARWRREACAGHLVFIGSHSGCHGVAGQANYAAAKAGVCGLTKSLATELGPEGIRVNAVLPGFLETRMTRDLDDRERQRHLDRHVLGRFNQPADAARFVLFLDGLNHVSGQVFQLDSRVDAWA